MNLDTPYLLRAIIDSLEGEVLPHLEPQATPASNVRACLMLLTYLESQVVQGARAVDQDNRELRALLREALAGKEKLGFDSALGADIAATLERHPEPIERDPQAPLNANRDYQELLTRVIHALAGVGNDAKADFRPKLHVYLAALDGREMSLAGAALGKPSV